jgi:hypothetical protein
MTSGVSGHGPDEHYEQCGIEKLPFLSQVLRRINHRWQCGRAGRIAALHVEGRGRFRPARDRDLYGNGLLGIPRQAAARFLVMFHRLQAELPHGL